MREGWKREALDEACEITYGTRVTKKRDGGTVYPVYGGGGETFRIDCFNREACTIVARFGMSESCVRHVAGKFFLNDSGLSVGPRNTEKLFPRFLDYFLYASQSTIYSLGRGSAQKNLDVNAFRKLELCYPKSLPEQRRIVAILDEAFAGIATAVANTEKNLANARELFESYLSTIFCSTAERETKGWELVKLIEICEKITDGVHKKPVYVADGVPFIKINNLTAGPGISFDNVSYISEADHKEFTKRTNPERGDILITKDGTIGIVRVIETDMQFSIFVSVALIKPKDKGISPYLKYVLESPLIQNEIKPQGTALKHLYLKDLRKFDIPLAPEKKRENIVADLDALSDEIRFLESIYQQKLTALTDLKQSLLHKAFSGELTTAPQDEIETALA